MNESDQKIYKRSLRDEKISLGVWLLFLLVNVYDIFTADHVIGKEKGASIFTVIWFVLATRSFYKIKVIQLEYRLSLLSTVHVSTINNLPNKNDAPETASPPR